MEELNTIDVTEEVNEMKVEDVLNETDEVGVNPITLGIGLGALAIVGVGLLYKKVIKPAIQKHKDKKAVSEAVEDESEFYEEDDDEIDLDDEIED